MSSQQQQQLIESAMTMQKALETAYSDWNRDKKNSESNAESTETSKLFDFCNRFLVSKYSKYIFIKKSSKRGFRNRLE
jgi:hypothetical protein